MSPKPTISGYTTVRCAESMDYPYKEAIASALGFCDEVIVLDSSDRDDGTTTQLERMAMNDARIKHHRVSLDWSAPNHGVFDGMAKAESRSKCTGIFCWQFDCDEIVHEGDYQKIVNLVQNPMWNKQGSPPLIALPVVEYWGDTGKVRIDVNLWKWRLSLNHPDITHGIPNELRTYKNGLLYALHGTDGCDYISRSTGKVIPCAGYVPEHVENLRRLACTTNPEAAQIVERFVNQSITELPSVHHYSWWSISRKIHQYRFFWTDFWKSLYDEDKNDPTKNPFFPGIRWEDVTDDMELDLSTRLKNETSGWIFHSPWDGSSKPGIRVSVGHPSVIVNWIGSRA